MKRKERIEFTVKKTHKTIDFYIIGEWQRFNAISRGSQVHFRRIVTLVHMFGDPIGGAGFQAGIL